MTWEGPGRRRVLRPPCSPLSLRTHFKEQVVREILEKERTIASVAASYDLVPQTVGGLGRQVQEEARRGPGPRGRRGVGRDRQAEGGEPRVARRDASS